MRIPLDEARFEALGVMVATQRGSAAFTLDTGEVVLVALDDYTLVFQPHRSALQRKLLKLMGDGGD